MANGTSQRLGSKENQSGGWIDVSVCEAILTKPQNFICAVDGSDRSMVGFHYLTQGIMQKNRDTFVEVLHILDPAKDYLPPAWRPDQLRSVVENTLTAAVPQNRCKTVWMRKDGVAAGVHLAERAGAKENMADFVVTGFTGRKRKKDRMKAGSNTLTAIQSCAASVIVIKDEDPDLLPLRRPSKFVVSVSLNKASTKAFLDALRLSRPGDEIHVVYVKSFMEQTDSDYTQELREKYSGFFDGLKDGESQAFSKFADRNTQMVFLKKQRRESTAQAVVRYGEEIEADFMVVGTNTLRRVEKGKSAIGSVSLDIVMEWDRNFVVSHWLDLDPRLYQQYATRS
jgi:nucleotide-binding universal stress UspA family protein